MLLESLMNIFLAPVFGFFSMLPTVDMDFLKNWEFIKATLMEIFAGVGCILPIEEFIPLMTFQGALWGFRLIYALILRIKSFLPFWGGT